MRAAAKSRCCWRNTAPTLESPAPPPSVENDNEKYVAVKNSGFFKQRGFVQSWLCCGARIRRSPASDEASHLCAANVAEACGSRTRTFNSQLTANDDVAASAKLQLESIGVRTVDLGSKPGLLVANE